MKKQNYDITPGQDKFLPVNHDGQHGYKPDPLLRFQIDELSKPIRRSIRSAPDSSASITASLLTALVILGATIAIVHCNG